MYNSAYERVSNIVKKTSKKQSDMNENTLPSNRTTPVQGSMSAHGGNDRAANMFGGFGKLEKRNNVYETWDARQKTLEVRLTCLVLAYVFVNDDDKVSMRERRWFKRVLKVAKDDLSEEDYTDIESLIRLRIDKQSIIDFMESNTVHYSIMQKVIERIKRILRNKQQYLSLLQQLEIQFINNVE